MGQKTLHLEIWPLFSITEAYEIACIKFDCAGSPYVFATVGPYLSKEEASNDLQNIDENCLKKTEKKSYIVDF